MEIEVSQDERLTYLPVFAGTGLSILYDLFKGGDPEARRAILDNIAAQFELLLEPIMDIYGFNRDLEGVARSMLFTEDVIGCEPKGKFLSVSPTVVVRKVHSCPWANFFSDDGGTCRLIMSAMEQGIGRKYGLEICCEQNIAEGAESCIWKVTKAE